MSEVQDSKNISRQISGSYRSKGSRCRYYVKFICAHVFSQIGLCALVVGYTIMGAFTFEAIETSSWAKDYMSRPNKIPTTGGRLVSDQIFNDQMDSLIAKLDSSLIMTRKLMVTDLWNVTLNMNVLYEYKWKAKVEGRVQEYESTVANRIIDELKDIQKNLKKRSKREVEDKPIVSAMSMDEKIERETMPNKGQVQWTFPAALLYCVTVITTIGYGNIAPKTSIGKVVTIFYALIGIPLMLLCLTNIGDLLAHAFKFTYNKICCALCKKPSPVHCEEVLLGHTHAITTQLMATAANHSQPGRGSPLPDVQQYAPTNIDSKSISLEESAESAANTSYDRSMTDQDQVKDTSVPLELSSRNESDLDTKSPENYPEIVMMPEILSNGNEQNIRLSEKFHEFQQIPIPKFDPEENDRVPVFIVLMVVASYVCLGAAIFSIWEKWTFLDGAYFCFITLSTIGFGDLVPGMSIFDIKHEQGQAKLIICCFYLVLGLAIIAMSFNLVQEEVLVKCRRVGRNLGIYQKN